MKQFVATRAFIVNEEGNVLIIREAEGYAGGSQVGRYDLPGGKIETSESYLDAIQREVREETGLSIDVGDPFFVSEWYPGASGDTIQIIGIFFECTPQSTDVVLSDDHDDYQWIDPAAYVDWEIIDENIGAFQRYLSKYSE